LLKKHELDPFQAPPELKTVDGGKKELFKKRNERNMEEETEKFNKDVEATVNI
jgi:hypothetical protein